MNKRFRGFMPVVVDVETAGLDAKQHALLEMCVVLLDFEKSKTWRCGASVFEHILPFEGALLDEKSLEFNGIDPFQPLRLALSERDALTRLFDPIWKALRENKCQRAVLVGHNAWFDLAFVNAAVDRTGIKSPFHRFTCFDTATLAGVHYGQTVLAKAMHVAGIAFDANEAHSAIYDAEKTAALFCKIINSWQPLK
ncbi:MAG: ribonuclease T [Gammaproteobacteria bacterium]|nr:ribonuclease T [Gammaproteobacteria bacterium]MCH9718095.1 ribonuclease T [Gammaproteobacteria bacterium]MCH9764276.1 ribonuclease T [Gammaproteobacteria bacterium]